MTIFLSILGFLIAFSILVLVHELGHFWVAKRNGIKVEEFGFGLPPRIWGKKKGETLYSLNAIPVGGFVKLFGEHASDGGSEAKNDRSYAGKSKWVRTKVLVAGVVMNFFLAWLIISAGFMVGMEPMIGSYDEMYQAVEDGVMVVQEVPDYDAAVADGRDVALFTRVKIFGTDDVILSVDGVGVYSIEDLGEIAGEAAGKELVVYRNGESFVFDDGFAGDVVVGDFAGVIVNYVFPGSPADEAGISEGEIIEAIDGNGFESVEEMIAFVGEHSDERLSLSLSDGRLLNVMPGDDGKLGVSLAELQGGFYEVLQPTEILEIKDEQYPFYTAPYHALKESVRLVGVVIGSVGDLVSSSVVNGEVPEDVRGPVGIAYFSGVFVQEGFVPFLRFVALLSLGLAVLNILPFPALDGGKLMFVLIELVIRKRVPAKFENYVHALGFVLILALLVAITYKDILWLLAM
jgi:regulator of sigma E protease